MKRIYLYFISCIMVVTGLCTSCDAQLEQMNPNKATEDTFWQTEADFELALTSCYTPLKNALNGGYYGTRGVMMRIARADEVEFRNDISDVFQACYFTNTNGNSLSQGMFYQFYNALYRTNSIMQKLEEKQGEFGEDFVNKVKAECLFIRGFYLFQLGKEFKNAPLRLTASQSPSTFPLEKSSQAEIWSQAEQDLLTAASLLPVKNDVIGKPTKGAAYAVLGKIYVYEEDFDKAIEILEPLTKSPYTYRLVEDFAWNFDDVHENNEESIFELLMEPVGGTDIWGDGENINSTQTNTRPKEYAAPEASGWYEANPTPQIMDYFLEEKDKDGNFDYRARSSVAWDYEGCMYYLKPFREKFAEDRWNTYWILKYQNWNTAESEADPPMSCINERAIRYADAQQKIDLLLFDDLHGLHAGFVMRICFDSRKLGHFKSFQRLRHLAVDAVFLYATAAIHHQHFTSFRNQSGQTGYGTFAENNLYRVTKLKIIHGPYFELKPLNFISVSIFLVFRGKSPFIIQE